MDSQDKLAKVSNEQLATRRQSERDSVTGNMLLLAGQINGRDLLPGESRFWHQVLQDESPESIEWAFTEHLKRGKFFPRPVDIIALIEERAERLYAEKQGAERIDWDAVAREHASPEWQAANVELAARIKKLDEQMQMPQPPKPAVPQKGELVIRVVSEAEQKAWQEKRAMIPALKEQIAALYKRPPSESEIWEGEPH